MPTAPGSLAPQVPRRSRPTGVGSIYMGIGIVVFVSGLLSIGGAYGWKAYLENSQKSMQQSLAERKKDINLEVISKIRMQSAKINMAEQLLRNHYAIDRIFSIISALTSENVRFLSMDLVVPVGTNNPFQMTLTGYARSYPSVAFQSDVLNQLEKYKLYSIVKNPILSDPSLNQNGTVSFGLTANIDPSKFGYENAFDSIFTGNTAPSNSQNNQQNPGSSASSTNPN